MHLPKKIWRSSLSAFRPNVKCLLNEYVNPNLQTIRQGMLRFYRKPLFSRDGSYRTYFCILPSLPAPIHKQNLLRTHGDSSPQLLLFSTLIAWRNDPTSGQSQIGYDIKPPTSSL